MTTPYPGRLVPADRGPVPAPLRIAFVLMLVGAGYEVLGVIIALVTKSDARQALINDGYTGSRLDSAMAEYTAEAVVGGIVKCGLWIWMAFANRAGRNWARVTSTVFFAIDTLGVFASLGLHASGFDIAVVVAGWVLIAVPTMALLWHRESTQYIKAPRYREAP